MIKKLTPLEALCYLDDMAHGRIMKYDPHELKLLIETSLKALELIKELRIDLSMLESCESVKDYNFWRDTWDYDHLTQGEFNLLKEVLYDQKSKETKQN